MAGIKISVIHSDAFQIKADCLVLKFAQATYGLDHEIEKRFEQAGESIANKLPKVGDYYFTDSRKTTNTDSIIFIGVQPLRQFRYKEIREFGRNALIALADSDPNVEKIVMTIHGPGYGLDEIEAFKSQLAGIMDGVFSSNYPDNLAEIIFAERSRSRALLLQNVLENLFPSLKIPTQNRRIEGFSDAISETLKNVGYDSANKKSIFVAMPFASEFDDTYHYGIQGAVKSCGYLCERADLATFTGDVLNFIQERIASSHMVVADLTTANPNVYLEVGYAWGLNKATVLLVKDTNELKFDTQGQRCLSYHSIKDLEAKLKDELTNLNL